MPGSAVIVVIYACVVTCGWSFTVLSGWGILISFWSVLVFSSAFFSAFLSGTICPSSFVFPGAFFSIFSRKNWRHFAVTLHCCPTCMCWPIRPWLFKFFSMPPSLLQRTSLPVFQRGSSPASRIVFPALFPVLFEALPWMLPARSLQLQVR